MLLGIDIGTTHCKTGLFLPNGELVRLAARPTVARHAPAGYAYYDPDELWATVAGAVREIVEPGAAIDAVGIASMAETGLLLERATGLARTPLLPWFDQSAAPQAARLRVGRPPLEALAHTGLQPSFKTGLAKLLWWCDAQPPQLSGAVWLSVADFIAQRLTGALATDYSLAGRTGAFQLATHTWDAAWLHAWGLSVDLFPCLQPPGSLAGHTLPAAQAATGLRSGVPVAIAGHDHVVAAFAGGAVQPGRVFDSMGTAETLVGALPERPLGLPDLESGLAFGHHVLPNTMFWMGGLSMAGGSVEWARALLNEPALSYADLNALVAALPDAPSGLVYFPYLAGSGTPHADGAVRGAVIGLTPSTGRAALARAVFEGAAFELEFIRRAAEAATGQAISLIRAAGGGTRSQPWMQIKADVSNCRYEVPALADTTLLGAALIGGWAAGVYASAPAALAALTLPPPRVVRPRPAQHAAYQRLYQAAYLPLQAPLRAVAQEMAA
jgi:sugar (pentulose or hexulose) kinase